MLTVVLSGSGTGTVKSNVGGINCTTGSTIGCSATYNSNTSVTLTPTPSAESTFTGWSGGGCTGTGPCTVVMTAATSVNAQFDLILFSTTGSWNCASGVSCEDVYDFGLAANTTVTIQLSGVTGASVLRLGAFAPSQLLTGPNLLTGINSDRLCGGQNVGDTVSFTAPTTGTYRIAIARDWGASAGASGNYSLAVSVDRGMTFLGSTKNVASGATGTRCGYIFNASDAWACATSVSCQDVFDFNTLVSTTVTVAVSGVTGNSVVRMAVFDGSALNTTNRLNGNLADRKCAAQNANDSATSASLPAGLHRIAIGRDWLTSGGASGNYAVTITTPNAPLMPGNPVNTVDDGPSAFGNSGWTCP
jgi:hypothetical protein